MFPEPTELLLVGCSKNQCGPQDPNQIHWHQEPTRRHPDQGKLHTWWWNHFLCFCWPAAISVLQFVLKRCRKERKKIQVKKESQQNRSRWWVWLQGLPQLCHLRHPKAWGRKVMEIRFPGLRKLRKRIERGNPLWAAIKYHEQSTVSSFSARYSKWDDNQAWSSQEWKTDISMCDRSGSPRSSTRSRPWMMTRCSSTIQTKISPTSRKPTNENTGQFGVPTVFEFSVSHVSHDFALQKASMQSGNQNWTEKKEGFVISVAESMSKKG